MANKGEVFKRDMTLTQKVDIYQRTQMLQGIKQAPSTDKHKEAKSILTGLGEIRAKEEPNFLKSREEYMSFL